jgi:hypothetical protein
MTFPQAKYTPFNRIMLDEIKHYPKMEVQDIYKLVFQAAFGSQHAAIDSAMVFDWLNDEWESADTANPAPEIEPITPDTVLVRVNIGAYKKNGGDKQSLGMRFLYTAKHFKGSKKVFLKYWNDVEHLAKKDLIPFTKQELADYLKQMKKKGLPAMHHSEKYMQLYKPSYRVIAIDHR